MQVKDCDVLVIARIFIFILCEFQFPHSILAGEKYEILVARLNVILAENMFVVPAGKTLEYTKLLAKAKQTLDEVKPSRNTSTNENFHAHGRWWWRKGFNYSQQHWMTLVIFQFLSWNNVTDWKTDLCEAFDKMCLK